MSSENSGFVSPRIITTPNSGGPFTINRGKNRIFAADPFASRDATTFRAVVRVRLGDRPALLAYYVAARRARELARRPSKRIRAIETFDAIRLTPGYGTKRGKRPGSSRAYMEVHA